jgi:D-cysteine desulfhydrase
LVNDLVRVNTHTVARLARRTLRLLRRRGLDAKRVRISAKEVGIRRSWLGPGYGHSTPAADRATALFHTREGIQLEPVYTGKAGAALLDLNARGAFGEGPVLYWHTYSRPQDAALASESG